MQRSFFFTLLTLIAVSFAHHATHGATLSIDDFNSWTQVQDPFHVGMTGNVDSAAEVALTAVGAVPASVDIGYQSIDGNDVASSASGNYFSVNQDFHVAVDFDMTAVNSVGLAVIGMGIGEDGDGTNSAGPALAIINGNPSAFSGGARINDVTQGTAIFGPTATSSGRFFVRYDSATGDIIYGVNTTKGSASPSDTGTFSALQKSWNDADLLVSFFLRSDTFSIVPPLSAGTVNAVFSNFEVLEGAPVALVPEPASAALAVLATLMVGPSGRRRKVREIRP
jgi:hypothetical protein